MAEASSGDVKGEESCGSDPETKPKRQRKDREDETGDPLVVVGPEILEEILNYLDAHSVARCVVVSRGWHTVASSDRLWAPRVSYPNLFFSF
jgi:F-box domain